MLSLSKYKFFLSWLDISSSSSSKTGVEQRRKMGEARRQWVLLGASGGVSWGGWGGRGGQPRPPRPGVSGSLGGQQEGTLGRWSGAGVSCDVGSLGRAECIAHRGAAGRAWAQLLGSHTL